MISASKYQHITYFMSLLKVSLCINGPKQRLLCMDTRRGCRSKRSPTHWKNKNIFFFLYGGPFCYFFSMGRTLCYVVLLMRGLFHCKEAFLLPLLYVGGLFATSSSWCGAFFTMWGPFCYFSPCGGTFLSSWRILCLYAFFYGLAPSLYDLFCGRIILCNFHPMSSAITYSGH